MNDRFQVRREARDVPRLPPDLAALAARLERAPAQPPRFLRDRVLGGVIDALAEPEDAPLDLLPQVHPERWREAVAALAALVALLLFSPWLGAMAVPPPGPRSPRGPVASIGALADELPPAPPAAAIRGVAPPPPAPLSALALRTTPVRRLEQGDF